MRYYVKNAKGQELVCPSLADLHALYKQKFLEDDDLIRPERSRTWIRAGNLPALSGVRDQHRDPRRLWLMLAMAIAIALAVPLLVRWLR